MNVRVFFMFMLTDCSLLLIAIKGVNILCVGKLIVVLQCFVLSTRWVGIWFSVTGNSLSIFVVCHQSNFLFQFADIAAEKGQQALRAGIEGFDSSALKKTDTVEKNPLPTKEGKHNKET